MVVWHLFGHQQWLTPCPGPLVGGADQGIFVHQQGLRYLCLVLLQCGRSAAPDRVDSKVNLSLSPEILQVILINLFFCFNPVEGFTWLCLRLLTKKRSIDL